jgi:general secretion pathway protein F
MSQAFRVRYLRLGDSSVSEAVMDASDEAALRMGLKANGQVVLSVRAPSGRPGWATSGMPRSLRSRHQFPLFCREVRTLLRAGMTVVEAVETLSARERLEGRRESLSAMLLTALQQGHALSTALSQLPDIPAVLVAAVRAGERTSNLIEALDDYLRFDGLVSGLRKKVVSAAIYPALVSAVGLAIALFLLLVVMPNFATMYENLRGASAGAATWTIWLSQLIGENRSTVFAGLLLVAAATAVWIGSGRARAHLSQLGQSIPWVRHRVQDFQLAMMYQALALLLKGGYPMVEAMNVASQSALTAQLRTGLEAARARIERGGSVSDALATAQLCDEVGRRLMAAAERNGDFHLAADVVSRLHGERFELFVERTTRVVEPLLLLVVALGVGGIVIMMYLPVFDMATQLR